LVTVRLEGAGSGDCLGRWDYQRFIAASTSAIAASGETARTSCQARWILSFM